MTLTGNGDAVCSVTYALEASLYRMSQRHSETLGLVHEGGPHRVTVADCKVVCTIRRDHYLLT
jgi:hypothetical protein